MACAQHTRGRSGSRSLGGRRTAEAETRLERADAHLCETATAPDHLLRSNKRDEKLSLDTG
eukprot:4653202-Prymnesium_polylepis.1